MVPLVPPGYAYGRGPGCAYCSEITSNWPRVTRHHVSDLLRFRFFLSLLASPNSIDTSDVHVSSDDYDETGHNLTDHNDTHVLDFRESLPWFVLLISVSQPFVVRGKAVARILQQGGKKSQRGSHFLNAILDVCSNWEAKYEMVGHIFQMGGPGTTAPPLATALVRDLLS